VTVGMMTTGYDCEDILNVALARPIFSPTDFIQIKGRGTRLFTFKHKQGDEEITAKKDGFALFDFFANCEYFEEDFDYDLKLKLPKDGETTEGGDEDQGGGGGGRGTTDDYTNTSPDPMVSVARDQIGLFGMRIDREMYRDRFARQASDAVSADTLLRQAFESEDWPAVEERVRQLLFEKADDFWNLPKLQEIYKTDRMPSLREILARVFGVTPTIATRSQLADEAFERFVATQETNATHSRELKTVFVAFLLDPQNRMLLEDGRFADLRARDPNLFGSLQQLGTEERETLITYLRMNVPLGDFEQVA
jgi:type I restriction enzyme R subunit